MVLPDSFNQIGLGLILGYINRNKLNNKWKPFFKLDINMNDETGMGLSTESGINFSLIGHDNLSVGINYIKGFRGTEDSYYDIYIKWIFFF